MCIPCAVAVRLAISSGPVVSLVALTLTVLKSRAASWVRNGNPGMDTCGLPDRPTEDWNWLAIAFSVIARAPRSAATRSRTITISVIHGHLLRRRLRSGAGAPWLDP